MYAVNDAGDMQQLWHSEKATQKFDAAETAYDSLCRVLVKAEYVANGDSDMTKKVSSRQEAAKRIFEPVQAHYYAFVGKPQQMIDNAKKKAQPTGVTGAAPRVFNDSIRPEKLTLEMVPHDFRKWKKGIKAFFKINGLDAEDAEVGFPGMEFGQAEVPNGQSILWSPGRAASRGRAGVGFFHDSF